MVFVSDFFVLAKKYICVTIGFMKIIDAHSHIDYITHNFQIDVMGTVVCAVKESQWQILSEMIQNDDALYGAFGVHPWFVDFVDDDFDLRLGYFLTANPKYMIGEIGLDKYRPDMNRQIEIFKKQFDIAVTLKRTVFIHCVGAWDKILHILKEYKKSTLPTIVFHAFNGGPDILKSLINFYENNVMFSLSENALYDRICRIEQIPIDKILIESDGKSNVSLVDMVKKISEIKNNPNVCDIIYNNTKRILNNG